MLHPLRILFTCYSNMQMYAKPIGWSCYILCCCIAATFNRTKGFTGGQESHQRNSSSLPKFKKTPAKGFMFGHQDDLAYGVGWKYIPGKSDIKEVTGDYPAVYGWELGRIGIGSSGKSG